MKKLFFLLLISCTLFYACTPEDQSDLVTDQEEMKIDMDYLAMYQQFEEYIIAETKDDLNSLFKLYVAQIDYLGNKQSLTEEDFAPFVEMTKAMSFDELLENLSESKYMSANMLAEINKNYEAIKEIASVSERLEVISTSLDQTEARGELDLVVQILGRYSKILEVDYDGQVITPRDCQSECRWNNIYYGAYYQSYYAYLANCPHCYSEASSYAHDCGWLACSQFCN